MKYDIISYILAIAYFGSGCHWCWKVSRCLLQLLEYDLYICWTTALSVNRFEMKFDRLCDSNISMHHLPEFRLEVYKEFSNFSSCAADFVLLIQLSRWLLGPKLSGWSRLLILNGGL